MLAVKDREPHTQLQPGSSASKTTKGKAICLAWNDGQCVSGNVCPKQFLHVCNMVLKNGQICCSTGHRRCDGHQ